MPTRTRSKKTVCTASPGESPGATRDRRLRVLQIAHACHPDATMESRIGWYRAVHAARRHDVTVLHASPQHDAELAERAAEAGVSDRLRFVGVRRGALGRLLNTTATTYYFGYRLWHRAAFEEARRRHAKQPFGLVHQTTFCGYREPGEGWRLGPPFVWGPVGGTQGFPRAYLGQLAPRDAWIEVCRNAINAYQLGRCRRVRRAVSRSAVLLAATRRAADDLHRAHGAAAGVQLETALDVPVGPPRSERDPLRPLRLLWSGRLRAWKTLPLLLRALPKLPRDVDWRLRVLGVGQCEAEWKRLADRLGLTERIDWLGWPDYRATLPHYRWADAFVFTSMRDTSGTGLLEALAEGAPIIGVDHQGAADVMTPACALPVPVRDPHTTINDFADAITRLAGDPRLLKRLSDGARERAKAYGWEAQADDLLRWYEDAADDLADGGAEPCSDAASHGVGSRDAAAALS
ncbi:MAG: glycosyltransferase family 4 protein [Planctomycetota bacterium]